MNYLGFRVYGDDFAVLHLWDLEEVCSLADTHWHLQYQLDTRTDYALFKGQDFRCPKIHAIDSDEAFNSCMGFLTLRPRDTDEEYFKNYTPDQLAWCQSDECESIGCDLVCE